MFLFRFYLNSQTTKTGIANALLNIGTPRDRSSADLAQALRQLSLSQFQQNRGDRSNVPNIAMVITDSRADDPNQAIAVASQAKNAGIRMFSFGVGNRPRSNTLQGISSDPQQSGVTWWRFNNYNELVSNVDTAARAICTYNFSPQQGWSIN